MITKYKTFESINSKISLEGKDLRMKIWDEFGSHLSYIEQPSGQYGEIIDMSLHNEDVEEYYPKIQQFIEGYNWYSQKSQEYVKRFRQMPIYAKYSKATIDVPEILYHGTPSDKKDIILKEGLKSRSEDIRHKYPPRVYLSTNVNSLYPLIKELKRFKDNKEYVIFGIDTNGLNLTLYKDQNSAFSGNCYIQEMDIPANKIWIYDDNGI